MATKFGTTGNDTLQAGTEGDTIVGDFGMDQIAGAGGNDFLLGNQDNDTITGADGADTIVGGRGDDVLYGNQGNDIIYGNESHDLIFGGFGDDLIFAGQGDDTVAGNEGNDTIFTGEGNNTASGGEGIDTLVLVRAQADYTFARNTATGDLYALAEGEATLIRGDVERVGFGNSMDSAGQVDASSLGNPVTPGTPPAAPFTPHNNFTFNGSIPATDTKPNGDLMAGTGNPGTFYNGVTNSDASIHLFSQESYRGVSPPIRAVSSTQDGVTITNRYNVAAGTVSTANGSDVNRPDLAASVGFFDIGTDGGQTLASFLSGGGRIERSYDSDRTAAVAAYTGEARVDAGGVGLDWFVKGTNTNFQSDDGGDGNTSANAYNRAYIAGFNVADLTAGSQFTDTLTAFDSAGHVLASIRNEITLV